MCGKQFRIIYDSEAYSYQYSRGNYAIQVKTWWGWKYISAIYYGFGSYSLHEGPVGRWGNKEDKKKTLDYICNELKGDYKYKKPSPPHIREVVKRVDC